MDEVTTAKLKYGLEGLYLTITKMLLIVLCWIILGTIKEGFLFLLFYFVIRFFAFGVHARTSLECLIISILIFVGIPFIAIIVPFNLYLQTFLNVVSLLLILIYAPADTHKRPLLKKKTRAYLKRMSLMVSIILITISILFSRNAISNLIVFALLSESILITPFLYKLLNVPYSNYKSMD